MRNILIAGLMTLLLSACAHQPTNDENRAAKSQQPDTRQAFAQDECRDQRRADSAECRRKDEEGESREQAALREAAEREQELMRELNSEVENLSTTPIPRRVIGRDLRL